MKFAVDNDLPLCSAVSVQLEGRSDRSMALGAQQVAEGMFQALSKYNGSNAPVLVGSVGDWTCARDLLPNQFFANLKKLVLSPKGMLRLHFQQEIHEHWNCFSDFEKLDLLERVGSGVLSGELGASSLLNAQKSLIQTCSDFELQKKRGDLSGAAITWLRSMLSTLNANNRLQRFSHLLSEKSQEGLGLVLRSKPNRNMIDVDFDYKHFLKFNTFPISLPADQQGREIAIVGSGVAAVVSAQMLLQAGVKPVIFERSSEVGGRLRSQHYHDKQGKEVPAFSELGAMRFPSWGRTWFFLLKRLGVPLSPCFPNPGMVPTVLRFNNQTIDWPVGAAAPDSPLFQKVGKEFNQIMDRLLLPMDKARQANDSHRMREIFQTYLDKYSGKTFYAVLIECLQEAGIDWTKEEFDAFGALGIGTGGLGVFYPISFVEILRVMLNKFESDQHLLPNGSNQALKKLYQEELFTPEGRSVSLHSDATLKLNTQVMTIKAQNGRTLLECKDTDGRIEAKTFDAVIVATTPQAMQDMGLLQYQEGAESVIAPEVASAIAHLNLVSASKLLIRTAKKFWLDEQGNPRKERRADGTWGVMPQNIQTTHAAHGVYCLDYPNTEHGVVALSYCWGVKSHALMKASPQERLDEFKKHIAEVSPEFAENLIPLNGEIHCVDWQNQPGHYGAFKLNYPGQEVSQQEALYQFQDASKGVVLAGDSLSHMGGWAEGAVQTGIHAACAIAKYLGGQVAEGSPLEINKQRFSYGKSTSAVDLSEAARILALTASQVVDEISEGRTSATTYIRVILDRAKQFSGLNSIITLNEEAALESAKQVDDDRALGRMVKPLAGLPIVVKDNINTSDLPTTAGTLGLKNFQPTSSAPVLKALLDAGAILIGKANMHELSFGVTSTNLSSFAGPVRNPYNRDFIPGGSSGGTAAAIAARIVPAGLGTDTGGSTRIPAALCGVVGFRPSVGNGGEQRRYSLEGVVPVSSTRDTVGPMARTVKDVALLDAVITNVSMPEPLPLDGLRFGLPSILWQSLSNDVADAMRVAKMKLSEAGVVLVDIDMPDLLDLNHKVSLPIALHESYIGLSEYFRANGISDISLDEIADQISSPDVREIFKAVKSDVLRHEYVDALGVYRPQLCELYEDCFKSNRVDVLFFPTTPVAAVPIDFLTGSSRLSVQEGGGDTFATLARNTEPGSNAGLPGLSLPVGMTPARLPIGMEIDGPQGSDERLLAIGLSIETLFGPLSAPQL